MTDAHGCPPALRESSLARSARALAAAQRAVTLLDARGVAIDFPAVAAEAGVSLSYIYKTEEVADRIRELRIQRRPTRPPVERPKTSERGLKTKLEAALSRNAELEAEIKRLRLENRSLLSKVMNRS